MVDPTLKYRKLAYHDARDVGLDPLAFIRQIRQESNFDPNVTSSAGARGIAQIMPGTGQSWGVDPNDPVAALKAAASHMAQYVKQFGSLRDALVAYNAGPGAVGGSLPSETQHYIDVILGGQGKGQTKLLPRPGDTVTTPPQTQSPATPPATPSAPTTPAAPTAPAAPKVDQTIPKLLAVFGAMNQANANQPWLGPPQNAPRATSATAQNPYSAILAVGQPSAQVETAMPIPQTTSTTPQKTVVSTSGVTAPLPSSTDPRSKGAEGAIDFANSRVGQYQQSQGNNLGPQLNKLEALVGMKGAPWCAIFATTAVVHGGAGVQARSPLVAQVVGWANEGSHGYKKGVLPTAKAQAGDLVVHGTAHIGIVVGTDNKGNLIVVEGNAGDGGVKKNTYAPGQFWTAAVRPNYKGNKTTTVTKR